MDFSGRSAKIEHWDHFDDLIICQERILFRGIIHKEHEHRSLIIPPWLSDKSIGPDFRHRLVRLRLLDFMQKISNRRE